MVAVIAVLALVMAATITLLMTYVPDSIVGAVPAAVPGSTGGSPPPSASVPAAVLPRHEVERLLVFSAVALAVVVAAGAGAVRWIVRRSLAPLHMMIAAARQAAKTDLRARIPVGRGRDEVTDLAANFNHMLARLDAAFGAQRRFAANASHELQTPLAVTQAALDDALAETPPGPTRDLLQDLRSLNSRSVRTVRTLLDLAETEGGAGHPEQTDLALLLRQEVESQQTAAQEYDVTVSVNLDPAVVEADPTLLRLMVRNLLDNAIRHNHRGGQVDVSLHDAGPELVLSVANTGTPMSPDEVAKIVEPFRRGAGRLRTKGSGLGATLIAAIVTRHGWRLRLHPGADGGLTAEIRMPHQQGTYHPLTTE
jgi:two-component system sensor histidine kinase VanS